MLPEFSADSYLGRKKKAHCFPFIAATTALAERRFRQTSGNRGMTGDPRRDTDIHQHRGRIPQDDFTVNYITIRLLVSPRRPQPTPAHR